MKGDETFVSFGDCSTVQRFVCSYFKKKAGEGRTIVYTESCALNFLVTAAE